MWRRQMVLVDGAETKASVNVEGEAPGIPTVLEWPVEMPVNAVIAAGGADWYAAGCEHVAGVFHVKLSAAAIYVAPPEQPRPPAITDNVFEKEQPADPAEIMDNIFAKAVKAGAKPSGKERGK